MEKTRYRLKEVLRICNGKDHSNLEDGEYPVLGSGGIMRYANNYLYDGESVLLPRKGTLNNIQYINGKFWTVDTCYYTEVNKKKAVPYYLYRLLRSIDLSGLDSGASIPSMTSKCYYGIKVPLPPLSTQRRIAEILSRYDEAIENNNKRIKLLEQMAQNLYKEWFVRFRFPGYESAEFENGLPKGWYQGRLSELVEFQRGKNITAGEMQDGFVPVISAGLEPSGYHNVSNVKGTSITISSSGANAGYISIHYEDIWAADCMFVTESKVKNIYYAYELLNNIRPAIDNLQRGAAQPHVYPKDVNQMRLYIPGNDLMENANKILGTFHKEIYQLQKQNQNLSRQRDMLLPRLMSGKLQAE